MSAFAAPGGGTAGIVPGAAPIPRAGKSAPADMEKGDGAAVDDGNKTDDDAAVSSGGGTIGVGVTPSLSRAPSREARSVSTWRWRWVSEGFIGGAQAARTQGENAVLGASKFAVVGKNARRTYA